LLGVEEMSSKRKSEIEAARKLKNAETYESISEDLELVSHSSHAQNLKVIKHWMTNAKEKYSRLRRKKNKQNRKTFTLPGI
jgi:hypothetical protein